MTLDDGREVVVKVRQAAARIQACEAVHRHLWSAGFPCARLLAGPLEEDGRCVTVEELVRPAPSETGMAADVTDSAAGLARLVTQASSMGPLPALDPPPPWVWWDHRQEGPWPIPDDRPEDLNAHPGPAWLDEVGRRVRERLRAYRLPPVIGHGDWEAQNVLWNGGRLHVVHDWDSVVSLPEAAVAGAAAGVFAVVGGVPGAPTVRQTAAFVDAYERARGLSWSRDDREVCWAAGLWVRAFNAKKASLDPGGDAVAAGFREEALERLRRSGA
ncbi:phosphotransferase [Micromonospora schwarzwaldensis]|uniref:phosphotransferase n=1 Tax=Micromonospora sp. DSM 45708 TaxID=3111767 RepID=UPI0031CE6632